MKAVEMLFLNRVYGPGFTGIQKCVDDTSMIHFELGLNSQLFVVPHSFTLHAHNI